MASEYGVGVGGGSRGSAVPLLLQNESLKKCTLQFQGHFSKLPFNIMAGRPLTDPPPPHTKFPLCRHLSMNSHIPSSSLHSKKTRPRSGPSQLTCLRNRNPDPSPKIAFPRFPERTTPAVFAGKSNPPKSSSPPPSTAHSSLLLVGTQNEASDWVGMWNG